MVLATSGSTLTEAAFQIRTQKAGFPGADQATFLYKPEGSSDWRGWDAPTSITDWESIYWASSTSSIYDNHEAMQAVTLASGDVLCVMQRTYDAGVPIYCTTAIRKRSASTDEWSDAITVFGEDARGEDLPTSRQGRYPCLVVLPSGRVLCFAWVWDADDLATIRMDYSDDDGETWTLGSVSVLPEVIDTGSTSDPDHYYLHRIRAAYGNGQIMLTVALQRNNGANFDSTFRQYASSDLGASFDLVEEWPDTSYTGGKFQEVLWLGSRFAFIYIDAVSLYPCVRYVGSATRPISEATKVTMFTQAWGTYSGDTVADGDLAACVDESGNIYCFGRYVGVSSHGVALLSRDGGDTWEGMGSSSISTDYSLWWAGYDSSTHPTEFCATSQGGRILMPHRWDASPGNEDQSLACIYLGGFSTSPQPGLTEVPDVAKRMAWTRTWLPYDEPDDMGWSFVGSATEILTGGALRIGGSTSQGYYHLVPTSSITQGLVVEWSSYLLSGGDSGTNACAVRAILDDGADGYGVSVRLITTGFRAVGEAGGYDSGIQSVDLTDPHDFRLAISGSDFRLWYRATSTTPDRAWTLGASGTLGNTSGAWGANRMDWGHVQAGTYTQSYWTRFAYSDGSYCRAAELIAQDETTMQGRPYAGVGKRAYVYDGVYITAQSGPTYGGESWTCSPSYGYALTRATDLSTPSPRVGWRSQDLTEQTIAWELDASLGTSKWGETLAIGIFGSNVPKFEVWGHNGSSWSKIDDVNSYPSGVLPYFRPGTATYPASGGDGRYFRPHELAGSWWCFSTTAPSDPGRTILDNSEGTWSTDGVRPVVRLGGVDGTEDTYDFNGLAIPRDCVILIDGWGTDWEGVKLVVVGSASAGGTSFTPPEDHWQIGTLMLGTVHLHGDEYAWGRTVDTEAQVEVTTLRDGTTRTRVMGPPVRTAEFGWSDGVDTTSASGDGDPDFVKLTDNGSARPVANVRSTPWQVEGLLHQTDGPHLPVIYLPRIERGTSQVQVLSRRHELMLARMTSPVRLETVVGDEDEDELIRIASITLREEV
jgi:hypothetical protein